MATEALDVDLLREEHRRVQREADAYIGIAAMCRDNPDADAAYMRRGHTMDRIAELIAEEIDRAIQTAGATQEGEG